MKSFACRGEVDTGNRRLDQLFQWGELCPGPCTPPANGLGCAAATPWDGEERDRPPGLGALRASGHVSTHRVISSAAGCGDVDALQHHLPNLVPGFPSLVIDFWVG